MSKYPPAAYRLLQQVQAIRGGDVTMEPVGEPDGFGVTRTVKFDPDTAGWLEPILFILEDARIEEACEGKVTFVPDIRADFRHGFDLESADAALNESDEEDGEPETGDDEESDGDVQDEEGDQ